MRFWVIGTWICWFTLYLHSLSPSLAGEDSGEFSTVAATLGLAHPPGYPLYAALGRLMVLLPCGSIAYRMNLFSAICAATTVALLFLVCQRVLRNSFRVRQGIAVGCALVACACLGFSQAFWHQATISDKYPLNMMLISAIVAISLSKQNWMLIALCLGISLSHHLQTLYLVPGLIWLAWRSASFGYKRLTMLVLFLFLALTMKFIFLPIRASQIAPPLFPEPRNFLELVSYLRADVYAKKKTVPIEGAIWKETFDIVRRQITIPGVILGGVGLAMLTMRDGVTGIFMWLMLGTSVFLTSSLKLAGGREFYLFPAHWVLGLGVGCLMAWGITIRSMLAKGFFICLSALPLFLLYKNSESVMRNRLSLEYDYGRNLLAGLPKRTVLFIRGDDQIAPTLYLQSVEGYRTDVAIISDHFLTEPLLRKRTRRSLEASGSHFELPKPGRDEDAVAYELVKELLKDERPCFITDTARTGVYERFNHGWRDFAIEIFGNSSLGTVKPSWQRTRGWFHSSTLLTERQRRMIQVFGSFQRQYGDALANSGRVKLALPRYRYAFVNLYLTDHDGAANNFALALEKVDMNEEALRIYRTVVQSGSRRPEVYLNMAGLLERMGRISDALRMYERGIEVSESGSRYARYARAQLRRLRKVMLN